MLRIALLITFVIASVQASCDNACSGHGSCGARGVCSCYDNWGLGLSHLSGDCSERICPYEFAWVDTPDKIGSHHKYAECSNRGICNRNSGECECFPGYEGKGCQRTTCPNDCSGHGRCKYISELPYASVINDYSEGYFLPQDPKTFPYYNWDNDKTRGCVCDPEYGDIDCSKRLCQHGTDVMDQRENVAVAGKYQTQKIKFVSGLFGTANVNTTSLAGQTFALTFKSKLNETFTTKPIAYFTDGTDFRDFILDVKEALERLPNRVIDKVDVQGYRHGSAVNLNITFSGENVQGPQNLVTVKNILCGDGCTPKLSGLELYPGTQNVTELVLSDFNSFECGRRGKCDYTTGQCTCFAGYTGLSCNVITSLV